MTGGILQSTIFLSSCVPERICTCIFRTLQIKEPIPKSLFSKSRCCSLKNIINKRSCFMLTSPSMKWVRKAGRSLAHLNQVWKCNMCSPWGRAQLKPSYPLRYYLKTSGTPKDAGKGLVLDTLPQSTTELPMRSVAKERDTTSRALVKGKSRSFNQQTGQQVLHLKLCRHLKIPGSWA